MMDIVCERLPDIWDMSVVQAARLIYQSPKLDYKICQYKLLHYIRDDSGVIVAKHGAQVIGVLLFALHDNFAIARPKAPNCGWIGSTRVHSDYQGSDVFRSLIKTAFVELDKAGKKAVIYESEGSNKRNTRDYMRFAKMAGGTIRKHIIILRDDIEPDVRKRTMGRKFRRSAPFSFSRHYCYEVSIGRFLATLDAFHRAKNMVRQAHSRYPVVSNYKPDEYENRLIALNKFFEHHRSQSDPNSYVYKLTSEGQEFLNHTLCEIIGTVQDALPPQTPSSTAQILTPALV